MMRRFTQAALAAVVALGLGSWGCTQTRSRAEAPPPQHEKKPTAAISDATITASVKLALAVERGVKATDINVDTNRGTVTLTGTVPSDAEHRLAIKVAEDVEGVQEVVDHINVSG
jgi:hyperosmotically inducible protein